MEELPIEVLANHLFKYFSFPEWLRTLVPVCKLWQQAAISSNASKQVVVDLETSATNRHYCIQTISKYKIDTIIVSDLGTSINFFERLLAASPKLNTIAFVGSNYDHEALTPAHSLEEMFEHTPKRTFPHITTLSVNAYHFALLPLFPNVSRLRIEEFISDEEILEKDRTKILSFPKIRELEITQQSFGGWESIQLQFPNLEILYTAILDYAKNAEIIAKGKELGIKVFCESTHLVKTSWNLPNVSYHLYAFEHRKTPLAYPVTIANAECSLDKLQEIMARTSPAYEKELATRIAEFNFPMRTRAYGTDPVSLGTFPNIRKPEFIKPLYENKFLEFWTAFQNAVNVDQTELSIELSKELVNNIDADTTNKVPKLSVVLKFIEKITDTQLFLDAVGSDAVKKIMSVTDKQGHNVIALWAMSNSRDINWKPIDEYIDWNTKVNHGSKTEPKYGNLATAAFTEQRFDKWKFLMNEKKQEVDLELVTDDQFKGFIRRDDLDDMALLAVNKEITSRIVFEASLLMGEDEDLDSYKALIAKFGSEYLTQCYKGTYLLQYLVGRARRHRSMFFPYLVNEHKLDINYIDENGKTPLTALIPKLQETEDVNVVQTLLNLGADPNLAGDTILPLFLAMELTIGETNQVVETLIDAGANVNAVDFDKNGRRATPLSMAVSKGVPKEIVESLIMHRADTKFVDDAGNTLIHTLLLAEGLDDIIQLLPILVKHVDINQPNLLGETPLHRALLSGYDTSLISKLVECGADVNQCGGPPLQPPLVMALNYFPTIKALLKSEKLDIKAKNRVGESTFYILVRLNFTTGDFDDVNTLLSDNEFLEVAVKYGTPENIEFIVSEVKRAINDYPGGLRNLFTLCVREMTLLKFLIENVGLDVNTKTAIGKTLLSSIVISMKNSYEVAEYLIQKGADVNVQDNYGDTPLMIAVRLTSVSREQYRYRQLLMKHGASVTLKNNLGIAPIDIDPMIETRYLEEERSMAYYDDRTAADLLTPSLAELRKKAKQNATDATDPGNK